MCLFVCCSIAIVGMVSNVSVTANQQVTNRQIVFTNCIDKNRNINLSEYTISGMRNSSDLTFIETKPAELMSNSNGTSSILEMTAIENEELLYTVIDNACNIDIESNSVIPPVIYFEEKNSKKITIPLAGESKLFTAKAYDSTKKIADSEKGVLVEISVSDSDVIPYSVTLVSGEKKYTESSMSYYFDNKTGKFTHGYWIFYDITMDELADDAVLESSSTLNKCDFLNYYIK